MTVEIVVRKAEPSDAENLAALGIQVWLHTYATQGVYASLSHFVLNEFAPARFVERIGNQNVALFVAECDKRLVGYIFMEFEAKALSLLAPTKITNLYVQEHFLRRGIGSLLLRYGQQEAERRKGTPRVWLTVNANNHTAINFYERLGFTHDGVAYFELDNEKHKNFVLVSPKP